MSLFSVCWVGDGGELFITVVFYLIYLNLNYNLHQHGKILLFPCPMLNIADLTVDLYQFQQRYFLISLRHYFMTLKSGIKNKMNIKWLYKSLLRESMMKRFVKKINPTLILHAPIFMTILVLL